MCFGILPYFKTDNGKEKKDININRGYKNVWGFLSFKKNGILLQY